MQRDFESSGVTYICFGNQFRKEAMQSIASLREVSPSVSVAVITDSEWHELTVPDVFIIRPFTAGYSCKPAFMYEASPFERTLFLDTDTLVARDIRPIFNLLDFYDVGVRFGGPALRESGMEFHAQCNSGVVLFKKCEHTHSMFDDWKRLYLEASAEHSLTGEKGLNDQRYLSIAIARSKARPAHLDTYLNFTLFDTITTYSPPAIYHGRISSMKQLDEEISGNWDPDRDWHVRLWLPNIRGIVPAGIRRSDPVLALALVLRRVFNESKRLLREYFRFDVK